MKQNDYYIIFSGVLLLLAGLIIVVQIPSPSNGSYTTIINRIYQNSDEEQALAAAETFNFSSLLNIPQTNQIPLTVIDNVTMSMFRQYAIKSLNSQNITLNYTVMSSEAPNIRIKLNQAMNSNDDNLSIMSNSSILETLVIAPFVYPYPQISISEFTTGWKLYTYNYTSDNYVALSSPIFSYELNESSYFIAMQLAVHTSETDNFLSQYVITTHLFKPVVIIISPSEVPPSTY